MSMNIVGLFCEDIREEKGNKESFLGIFPDNVNVSAIPGLFPKLCVYVRMHIQRGWKPQAVSLVLRLPDGTDHSIGGVELPFVEEQLAKLQETKGPYAGILFKAQMVPLPIVRAGRLNVVAKIGKKEFVCCSLNVQLDPNAVATASAQPASQSPPAA